MADVAAENVEVVGGAPARALQHVADVLKDCADLSKQGVKAAFGRMEGIADKATKVEEAKIIKTLFG